MIKRYELYYQIIIPGYLLNMMKFSKHIRIRITEDQFNKLVKYVLEQRTSTSRIIREAITEKIKNKKRDKNRRNK